MNLVISSVDSYLTLDVRAIKQIKIERQVVHNLWSNYSSLEDEVTKRNKQI